MRRPTPEQNAVLSDTARVRVIRAAPGSGKTWLVAEVIRQELGRWSARTSGVAALSFTRVAGDEIRRAVGYELTHPHFVGTIDAFLFRYVVRPFLRCCFSSFAAPRLIPAEFGADHWNHFRAGRKAIVGKGINLFGCIFVDEVDGRAVVAYKPHPAAQLQRVDGGDDEEIKNAKWALWKGSGLLTHSDAALWSSKILGHDRYGAVIRQELARRFPLIIVDEFQDTGYFLGKSVLLLLAEPSVRGVLVGDPDQAIYEFSGARPDLFNRCDSIPDAVTLPLARSRRCPPAVMSAAAHLKDSGGVIEPAEDRTGRALLLSYDDMVADISRLVATIGRTRSDKKSKKIVARHNGTLVALAGRQGGAIPKLGCPPLNHLHRAVVAFREGRQVAALAAARAALELVLFEHEGVEDSELQANGIERDRWQHFAVKTLLRASAEPETGTLYEWQQRLGTLLDEDIVNSGLAPAGSHIIGRLKPIQKRSTSRDGSAPCAAYLPIVRTSELSDASVSLQTVHGVKGETHDVTMFVCPEPKAEYRCPSTVWWSTAEKDREERRIAYVAMTRTRGDLIVCVSTASYGRLVNSRPKFVAAFECMTIAQYVEAEEAENSQRVHSLIPVASDAIVQE